MLQRNLVFFFKFTLAVLLIHAIMSAGVGTNFKTELSMENLVKIQCTEKQPFKCAPYGACCRGSEFCYSGLCETCFPSHVQKDGLLTWCRSTGQYNTSAMRSPLCRLACQDVFNSEELMNVDGSQQKDGSSSRDADKLRPNVTNPCSDGIAPHTAASKTDDGFGSSTGIALFVTVLVFFLIISAGLTYVIVKVKSLELVDCDCYNNIRRGASRLKECMCCSKKENVASRRPNPSGPAPQPQAPGENALPAQVTPPVVNVGEMLILNTENENQSAGNSLIAASTVHLPPLPKGNQASLVPTASLDQGQGKPHHNTASDSPTVTSVAEQAGSDGSRLNSPDQVSSTESSASTAGEAGVGAEESRPLIISSPGDMGKIDKLFRRV